MNELLKETVKQYIKHNAPIKDFDASKINERHKLNYERYYNKITETVKNDFDAASLGIPTKKPTLLQKQAAKISLTHGLTMYAKFLCTGIETINEIK